MKRAVLIVAVATLCVTGSAVAQDRNGGMIGSGTRAEDSGQIIGSGSVTGQTVGSGGFTMTTQDQYMGSGGRTADDGQILGSGGLIGSGTRTEHSGYLIGGNRDGYVGSGLSVLEIRSVCGTDRACWW
jgi:hypothetical protein